MKLIVILIFLFATFIPSAQSQNIVDTLIRSERWMIEKDLCSANTGDTIMLISTHNYRSGNLNLSFKKKNNYEAIFKYGSYQACGNTIDTSVTNYHVIYSHANKIMDINLSKRKIQLKLLDADKSGVIKFVVFHIDEK